MNERGRPLILSMDDDPDILLLIEHLLRQTGFSVATASSGAEGIEAADRLRPDIILLDVMMPGMDGYTVCRRLQENTSLSCVPVIFLTAMGEPQDKARAFACGASDYLVKPVQRGILVERIRHFLAARNEWQEMGEKTSPPAAKAAASDLTRFKEYLAGSYGAGPGASERIAAARPDQLYALAPLFGVEPRKITQLMAEQLHLPYQPVVDPGLLRLGVLPLRFCREYQILPMSDGHGEDVFVISNPFRIEVSDYLSAHARDGQPPSIVLSTPEAVAAICDSALLESMNVTPREAPLDEGNPASPVISTADRILRGAIQEKASDIHMESKENAVAVRFRVDGDMRDLILLKKDMGAMVISRMKALGNMDVAEHRRPQDGSCEYSLDGRTYKFRLATTSMPDGEGMVLRVLDPMAGPKSTGELGMADEQARILKGFLERNNGLILIVGPTGSGKTTTLYSLLSQMDLSMRSLITVEDPVEYRIPHAKQQQVNEKAGVTFESILKSAVRQDPDIIYIGEIRDTASAKIAINFAGTGHLILSTLHTANAMSAVFRLERLEIPRATMADSLLCIVAQRLVKRLCPRCKKEGPLTGEESAMLAPYVRALPQTVAHPVGCGHCGFSGYRGREGVYEVLPFDTAIAEMFRSGKSIAAIRQYGSERGMYLLGNHAIDKVRRQLTTVQEVYQNILVEEAALPADGEPVRDAVCSPPQRAAHSKEVLVVDDDKDIRDLLSYMLGREGYAVTLAPDVTAALYEMGKKKYGLILSDICMPGLDGFKLLEFRNEHLIATPVVFLTASGSDEDELRGLKLGAADFIRKPPRKEILLARIKKIFDN